MTETRGSALEVTRSICPLCGEVIDAEILARDGKIVLTKLCTVHGRFEALLSSDAKRYLDSMRFNKPGSSPLAYQTEVRDGCPLDCGLCPDHKQHACLAVIEVNSGCNLDCPICFAESGTGAGGFSLDSAQVGAALDALFAAEAKPEVVMFSGGEPTIHPELLTFVRMANDRGAGHVLVNTNGLRLAADRSLARALASEGASVYLQFDGFSSETSRELRGRDLTDIKLRALERCADAGVRVALVAAVERGVNESELGDIVSFGLDHPAVNAAVFQPVTHTGRHRVFDPLDRVTNDEVVQLLVEQLPELLRPSDLIPVPCCFPTCRTVTYLLKVGREVVPVTRILDVDTNLDYITNRVLPDPAVREALEHLWSASAVVGTAGTTRGLECATCTMNVADDGDPAMDPFMIVIQDFQDAYTLNVRQLMKCCIVQATPDGRLIPFCAYNSAGYREQVREALTGVRDPRAVPHARPILENLERGPHGSMTAATEAGHL